MFSSKSLSSSKWNHHFFFSEWGPDLFPYELGSILEALNPQNHRADFPLGQAHGNKKFDLGPIAYPHLVGAQPCEMLGIPWDVFLWNKSLTGLLLKQKRY